MLVHTRRGFRGSGEGLQAANMVAAFRETTMGFQDVLFICVSILQRTSKKRVDATAVIRGSRGRGGVQVFI